jgi:death on curing protein
VNEPRWVEREALLVLHDRSLALHGGAAGLRDDNLLESALARPKNRFHYEGEADICSLAATYLVGLASNHPFVDGNKRAAFLAAGLFMRRNGLRITASQPDAARTVFDIAAGSRDIERVADWLRKNCEPFPVTPPPAEA